MTAAILVGGASRRMGFPKAWAEVGGVPSVERVLRSCRAAGLTPVFQGLDSQAAAAYPDIPAFGDDGAGQGPLAALATAFRYIKDDALLLLACDLPFLPPELLRRLAAAVAGGHCDFAVPLHAGRLHPLCAAYGRAAAVAAAALLAQGERSMHELLAVDGLRGVHVEPDPQWGPAEALLLNVNTPQDLELARGWAACVGG